MPSAAPSSSVLLVQLSDSHLFAEADGALLGMSTRDSLEKVVEQVLVEQPQIDLVVASGDISQDGSVESYEAFRRISARIAAPARWFAGNHDELPQMEHVAQGEGLLDPVVDIGQWRVTLLDSAVPGSVPGLLADGQLQLLERSLREAPDRHHLVCLHHHPVAIGCDWMAPIGLRNADALFTVLDQFAQVKALLWGHVHQEFDQVRNGVRLLASPSTCIQFAPGSVDFKVDTLAPGYRWLRLHDDGRLETGVSRVVGMVFEADYGGTGY
ncbi:MULTISPECIES: 3',5'-cyclic-AMP phosphodiesterase [Pseudomonas syringae group]|uniref:3',5'-cyclic-AMP phosphodiesterase n=3 Tax=Pseudomonas syringae group TaxID=136849 RepID=A0AAD0M4T1_9PSED|nr:MULTISPECIES: 3',5'-cyclic-AMP phosphodiesterase [Pseudomonas syringae group]AVB22289.1 3',5'-cyclic-AMP phosphodiesterase [Pseudomonas avellanae]POP88281.1 3',5'-cyclic-AMP phosphodiesterase [Pseudomonas amygdali pv. morsprunorum]RML50685.1 3',5'-cyclic adenosine monophosphate phosphodiesterase CpdA [Pseudomonas amygdali pv. morsprunorum]SOS36377.1 3',5'-cyclic adenosine monophosphate phosphodiesterase CpdA [Pseudomonas syringae group genomosp. 3]SPF20548.1 3',5'-cyclic adenosine monophosp